MDKHIFDVDGNYLGKWSVGVNVDETDIIVEIDILDGQFRKPMLVNGKVVEGLTQEEIDAIVNAPKEPTQDEILQTDINAVAVTTAYTLEDVTALAETVASMLDQITLLENEIVQLKGGNA